VSVPGYWFYRRAKNHSTPANSELLASTPTPKCDIGAYWTSLEIPHTQLKVIIKHAMCRFCQRRPPYIYT